MRSKDGDVYCLAEIDEGGFIYVPVYDDDREMVHRESIFPFEGQVLRPALQAVKDEVTGESPFGNPVFILAVKEGGGVEYLWCFKDHEELIRKRLKTWSGCYGAWPIRRLNGPVPLGRSKLDQIG